MTKKKEIVTYDHHLLCSKCGFKFQIESEEANNTKIGIDKMNCPICKKPAIQINPQLLAVFITPSKRTRRHANEEASAVALKIAAEAKIRDKDLGVDEMIPVKSTQKGKEKGKTRLIPKKVIDSIKEKVEPVLQE